MGRPTKYEQRFCDLVLELGKQGKSKVQMACTIGVSRDTVDEWCKVHPEFSDSITRARELSQQWWEDSAQENLQNKFYNAALWAKSMSARFPADYREKIEQNINVPAITGSADQRADKIKALMERAEQRKAEPTPAINDTDDQPLF